MQDFDDHDDKKKVATSQKVFKSLPVSFTCPHCDYTGYTIVEQKTTYISYVLMILFIFLFGMFFSIVLMPLAILLTRSFFHKCPSCFKEVGSDNKILSIFEMKDKVVGFHIGEFGVVLSRKILLGIFLTIILIITVYIKLESHPGHYHGPVVPTDVTWTDFLAECGKEAFLDDRLRPSQCRKKYEDKTIMNWRGFVMRIEDNRNSLYSFMEHAVVIHVRMEPREMRIPDIMLAADSERAGELNDVILNLNRGSEIIFNATIITFGEQIDHPRHFHLQDLKAGDKVTEIPEDEISFGRYSKHLRSPIVHAIRFVTNDNGGGKPALDSTPEKKE